MIKIEKLKFVLYDFDDTLCIHQRHRTLDEQTYNKNILLLGKDTFEYCESNKQIKNFIKICEKKGIAQGLISATTSCKDAEAKRNWVAEKYDIYLNNYSVGSRKQKVAMLQAICDAYGLYPQEILLIDDMWETLAEAEDAGFQACTPMEIVNYIDERGQSNA